METSPATPFVDANAPNMDNFLHTVLLSLVEASKIAQNLPVENEYQYMSTYSSFRSNMATIGTRLLRLGQNLVDSNLANAGAGKPDLISIIDAQDAEDVYDDVSDVVDAMIERVVRKHF